MKGLMVERKSVAVLCSAIAAVEIGMCVYWIMLDLNATAVVASTSAIGIGLSVLVVLACIAIRRRHTGLVQVSLPSAVMSVAIDAIILVAIHIAGYMFTWTLITGRSTTSELSLCEILRHACGVSGVFIAVAFVIPTPWGEEIS